MVAFEAKTTSVPSALRDPGELEPLPWVPSVATLSRVVVRATRSRTKTSAALLVSPGTRLVANEPKATSVPSALRGVGPTL